MKKVTQILLCIFLSAILNGQPISLNPENHHYFLFHGKTLAIISSSEHYGAVLNPAFNIEKYLNTMQKDGMTYTRLFAGSYFEKEGSFGIEKNTLAPAPGMALVPWKRSNEPGAACGGNKFDLNQWDENYFSRLRTFVSEAGKKGIIVEVTLFSSIYGYWDTQVWNPQNNISIKGELLQKDVQILHNDLVLKYQEAVVRKIVKELNKFDNVIYEIQNEPWSDHTESLKPDSEFINNADFKLDGQEWQKRIDVADKASLDWQKKIADIIADEEKILNNRHLIAQNYSNFYCPVKEVNEKVSILNFHYAYPLAVEKNYNHLKVIGFDESGFAGSEDITYRKQAWKFIIAGGGLFNNLDYSFAVGYEDGTAVNKAPGGGSAELRKQLKVLSGFFHSFNIVKMKPDYESLISASGGIARVLSERGNQYAIYINNSNSCSLKLNIPPGDYKAEWVSTLDGSVVRGEHLKHSGGEITLNSPDYKDDIALKIVRK